MENILIDIERQILDLRHEQNQSLNVLKSIELLGEERKYYSLLVKHTKKLAEQDTKIEKLQKKIIAYEELINNLSQFININDDKKEDSNETSSLY